MGKESSRTALILIGFAFFVTGFEFALLCIVVPRYVHDVSNAVLTVSLIFSLSSITVFIGQNLFGFLFDRTGTFWGYIAISGLAFGTSLGFIPHVSAGMPLIVLLTATAFFQTALFPAAESYLTICYPLTKGHMLGKLFAFESIGWSCGALTAAVASLLVTELTEIYTPLFYGGAALAGIMFLVSVLYGTTTREIKSTSTVKPTPSGRPAQIKALFRDVKLLYTDQRIRRVCLVFLLLDGAMASFFHLFSVYFTKHLGGSWFSTCLCMGIAGTLGALTFPLFGRLSDRYGRKPLVFYAIAGNFIMFVGFLLIRNTIALAVLYTLPVYSAIRVAARGYLADLTEESTRGGGMGLIGSIQSLASGIAPLIAGALAARYGLHVLPWTALSFLVLSGLTALIFLEEYGQT